MLSGGYREDVTPVPIPNTEVKLLIGDDTRVIKPWESSTLPVYDLGLRKESFFYGYFFVIPTRSGRIFSAAILNRVKNPGYYGFRYFSLEKEVTKSSRKFRLVVFVQNSTFVEILSIRRSSASGL